MPPTKLPSSSSTPIDHSIGFKKILSDMQKAYGTQANEVGGCDAVKQTKSNHGNINHRI
jgi:hypothetical protein